MSDPLDVKPILLSSGAINVTTKNMTFMANMLKLSHRFGLWMYIDEIRFTVLYKQIMTQVAGGVPETGIAGVVSAKLTMGNVGLTNQFVPMHLFAPVIETSDESQAGTPDATGPVSFPQNHYQMIRWKLPRPLLVSPLNPIQCVLKREFGIDSLAQSMFARVNYLGRVILDPNFTPPATAPVPYVSSYVRSLGTSTVAISGQNLLSNPFLVPLNVQRLNGRVILSTNGLIEDQDVESVRDRNTTNITIKIRDSKGQDVVKDYLPFFSVFDVARKSWTFNRVLQPKELYTVYFSGITAATESPRIAIVGWREESVQ